jgi:hypothetical protein
MVQGVESLGTELELESLMDRKVTPESDIYLPCAKSTDEIPRCVTDDAGVRRRESCRIDTAPSRILGTIEIQRLARYHVQSLV